MEPKEAWIESVMDSLNTTGRAPAPPDIEAQIMKRIQRLSARVIVLPKRTVYMAAAALALLLSLNCYMMFYHSGVKTNNYANQDPISSEYFPNSSFSI